MASLDEAVAGRERRVDVPQVLAWRTSAVTGLLSFVGDAGGSARRASRNGALDQLGGWRAGLRAWR